MLTESEQAEQRGLQPSMPTQLPEILKSQIALEKATWSLDHRSPCDVIAVSSSITLPASARADGAATRRDVNT